MKTVTKPDTLKHDVRSQVTRLKLQKHSVTWGVNKRQNISKKFNRCQRHSRRPA